MSKKFAVLLALLATMAFSAVSASAADIKASGAWQVEGDWGNSASFNKVNGSKNFEVDQRVRTKFEFIANENLKGVFETQVGTDDWGHGDYALSAGRANGNKINGITGNFNANNTAKASDGNVGNIELRKAYIDFNWPGTKVNSTIGYQPVSLPSALGGGSPILDDYMGAAVVSVPVNDMLSFTGGYARVIDAYNAGVGSQKTDSNLNNAYKSGNSVDAAFLTADIKPAGFDIQPFFMYAYGEQNTDLYSLSGLSNPNYTMTGTHGVRGYWAGAAFTMTALDPFKIMADINYGKATWDSDANAEGSRSGYLFDIAADYTGLSMMTPELFFVYSSGENGNKDASGRMPSIAAQNYAWGTFWQQGGDSLKASYTDPTVNLGYWALGLSLKDIKFIDKLSHTVNFIYFKGTNDKDFLHSLTPSDAQGDYGNLLTTKDSLFEIDVNTKYQVYDQLALMLELGYINANLDKDTWSHATGWNNGDLNKDAYKASFMVQYAF